MDDLDEDEISEAFRNRLSLLSELPEGIQPTSQGLVVFDRGEDDTI